MKLSFYILITILCSLFVGSSASAAAELKIGFSAEPYPPFTYKSSSGQWTGFEIELADAICNRIDENCDHTPTAWSGIIPALQGGKIDAIMNSMAPTPAREKEIDFTRGYYSAGGYAFVAPKDVHMEIPGDLKGKILGVQGGTVSQTYAHKNLAPLGVRIRTYNTQAQLNRDLESYRVDVMLGDNIAMRLFTDNQQDFEIKGKADKKPLSSAIGIRKNDSQLKDKLNNAITDVLSSGECSSISKKYFGFDVCLDP